MVVFAVARSTRMMSRVDSASILSCADSVVASSTAAVAAEICARRAVSSSRFILRNIALVDTILPLVDEVLVFWIVSCLEEFLLDFYNLVD